MALSSIAHQKADRGSAILAANGPEGGIGANRDEINSLFYTAPSPREHPREWRDCFPLHGVFPWFQKTRGTSLWCLAARAV